MSFNGDAASAKRARTDMDTSQQRDHADGYKNFEPRRKRPEAEPNNVLLFTIINPVYPITVVGPSQDVEYCRAFAHHALSFFRDSSTGPEEAHSMDVLHTICTPNGQVLRIVIFKKNGVQAMVELLRWRTFDSIETARKVKDALNGADIYSGCCTLKIEFAKPTKLNVYRNDMDSWDYTTPSLADQAPAESQPPRQAPLLQEPRFGAPPQLYRGPGSGSSYLDYEEPKYCPSGAPPSGYGDYVNDRYPPVPPGPPPAPSALDKLVSSGLLSQSRMLLLSPAAAGDALLPGGGGGGGPRSGAGFPPAGAAALSATGPAAATNGGGQGGYGSVLMAYGLDPAQANPDRLFNLFCLYGNVIRIKFLKTKEGCAMIQMGDSTSVERCITHLKNVPLFGGNLQLGYSKQTFLSEVAQPYSLPDNSPSFKDFSASKNNRFISAAMASKNRIQGPAKILHFFNTPPDITEDQLYNVFDEKSTPQCQLKKPTQIKLFPKKERSSSGLLEFDELSDAVAALVYCNHAPIKNPESKFPYMMKLCFSSSRSIASNGGSYHSEHQ